MPHVYILECADGSFYVGSTFDLPRRLSEHQLGQGAKYTRRPGRRPVRLVYAAEYADISEAFKREKQIQGWSRRKRLALIKGDVGSLAEWSRRGGEALDRWL